VIVACVVVVSHVTSGRVNSRGSGLDAEFFARSAALELDVERWIEATTVLALGDVDFGSSASLSNFEFGSPARLLNVYFDVGGLSVRFSVTV
jgi:hypothetical protein